MATETRPVRLQLLLEGETRTHDEVVAALESFGKVRAERGRLWASLRGRPMEIVGLAAGQSSTERIWFSLPGRRWRRLNPLAEAARKLGWRMRARLTRSRDDHELAPELAGIGPSATREPARRNIRWTLWLVAAGLLLFFVPFLQRFWQITASKPAARWAVCAPPLIITGLSSVGCSLLAWRNRDRRVRLCVGVGVATILAAGGVVLSGVSETTLTIFGVAWNVAVAAWALRQYSPAQRIGEELMLEMTHAQFLWVKVRPRMIEGRCLSCGYDLRALSTCRCPECGALNYYLTEREDARAPALENGWIPGEDVTGSMV